MASTFLVAASKTRHPLDEELWHRLRASRPPLLFESSFDHSWASADRTVTIHAWEETTSAFGPVAHWHDSPSSIITFAGHPWPRDGAWEGGSVWAEQLGQLAQDGPIKLGRRLLGVYSLVNVDPTGSGFILSDPLGMSMIYTGETDRHVIFATRADAVAWALHGKRPPRDPMAGAWLAYAGHMIGDRTGFEGVRTTTAGAAVILGDGPPQTLSWCQPPWTNDDLPEAPEELARLAGDDIRAQMRRIAALPTPNKVAALTGGRDSRLNLGILMSERILDRVSFMTLGRADLLDVQIATELADRFGLEHRTGRRLGGPDLPWVDRIYRFVDATSGVVNIWDQGGLSPEPDTVNISGLCGEVLFTHFPNTNDVRSERALELRFENGWRFGPIGLLREDIQDELKAQARATVFDETLGQVSPIDLIDIFAARHRLRRWRGALEEVDRSNRVFPLYSLRTLQSAFRIGAQKRRADYLHHRILHDISPELADWRLAGPAWDTEMLGGNWPKAAPDRLPNTHRAVQTRLKAKPAAPKTAKQAEQKRTLEQRRGVLAELLHDGTNPVFDVLDRKRTMAALGNIENLDLQSRVRLFGAATAAIWMS